ncbi:hypothetical protein F5Y16DRAFT_387832 [Xylariaceae sp. FL0255]|nr:hypothetical protein F5Y16DRAFT_387832 [Xylariaceae sp. FL0255]
MSVSFLHDLNQQHEMAALPFSAASRKGDAWFFVGLTSSFPSITQSDAEAGALYETRPCSKGDAETAPGCKVFFVPKEDSSQARQVDGDDMIIHDGAALQDQVLVFQYRGKFHDSSFPLAKGTPFDIEDFGVVLSSGIHCGSFTKV